MPRTGQIIPSWLHPHEAVYINDNTRYEDVAFQNDGPTFLNVFMSRKGVDNKLKHFNSISEWVEEYGLPDYRRYGQPGYNAYVALSTGLAQTQSMRVMPADAAHANIVLVAKYQKKDGKLQMKFVANTVTNILDSDDLQAYVDRMEVSTPDEEGYMTLPIMSFWSRGRGVYGNDYRVRISRDKGADKDNDYVNYAIELLTTENGALETLETYTVSFYIDAIDPNSSFTLFVNDVIDDEEGKGSGRFNCSLVYDNLEKLFAVYEEVYNEVTDPQVVVEPVAVLPPTQMPDAAKLYIDAANEVWVFDEEVLTDFRLYAKAPKKVDVAVAPIVAPVKLHEGTEFILNQDNSGTQVFEYNEVTGMKATARNMHVVNSIEELSAMTLVNKDLYIVVSEINDVTGEPAVLVAEDDGEGNFVTTVVVATFVTVIPEEMPEGCVFAKEGIVYKNTVDGKFYVLYAGEATVTEITEMCEEVAALPATTLYVPGTVYELTQEFDGKAAGTQWIYSEAEGMWVEPADPEEPEPMVYTMATWDLFGYNKFTQEQDPFFAFDGGIESIGILSIEGIALESGNDGSFADDVDAATRDEAIEAAYLAAFQGAYDKAITSKRRAPVDLMLDANYPLNVKKAMVALAKNRYDAACHLDTNLINNVDDLETFYTQISDLSERIVSFDAGMFKTTDPITGKVIPVTISLWLSSKIPQHFNVYGNHTPLAGEEYATLSGYQKNSIRPIIDADDEAIKELLYDKLRMNYIECISENTYMRGTQQTSQNFWSDLSEENNMLVLLEIKRKIERLAAKNRYKWADPAELRLFKEACKEIFSSYQGTKCRTLEIDVQSNAWETTRYIVHVYLAVTFRTFQKRAIIEIDVNPRA